MKLRIATCQFPVSDSIERNYRYLTKQMREAKGHGAHLAHFCEGALSGYAGVDFPTFDGFDWTALEAAARDVAALAGELSLVTAFGSSHRRSRRLKPHNCVYIVDDRGALVDRYDKMFCAGNAAGTDGDLAHYSPGDHFTTFAVRGVTCGVLLCHDYRYPELYREYKQRGVELMLHGYHAGNLSARAYRTMQRQVGAAHHGRNPGTTLPEITMPATMHAAAAANHVWISCPNTAARHSCFGSFVVRADGVLTGRLPRHRSGVLMTTIDTADPLYDSTVAWRDRSMQRRYHSGRLTTDPRSRNRREF